MTQIYSGQIDPNAQTYNEWSYQRPADWLLLPEVTALEEKFVGLFPVFDVIGNFIALQFEGDYTVDWGDGTVEDVGSGVKAQHSYDYGTIDPATESTRGYRQVLVTVTPQTGQNLTVLDLSVRNDIETVFLTSAPWLDFIVSMPNADSFGLPFSLGNCQLLEVCTFVTTGTATTITGLFEYLPSLQTAYLLDLPNAEAADELFLECSSLRSIHLPVMPMLQYMADIFYGCSALEKVIIDGMPIMTDLSYLFYDVCYALQYVEIHNTPLVEDFTAMFEYCFSLKYAIISDMSSAISADEMFYECYSLKKFFLPATPLLENADYMFSYCYSLEKIVLTDLSSLVYANEMFYECKGLFDEILFPPTPMLTEGDYIVCCSSFKTIFTDLSSITNAYGFSLENYTAREITLPELPLVTDLTIAFQDNYALTSLGLTLSGPALVDMGDMVRSCESLRSISVENSQYIGNLIGTFIGCPMLSSVNLPGLLVSADLSYCLMSRDEIVSLFTDLGTASSLINVSGNYGAADLTLADIAIATDKGWTVLS